MPSTISLKPVNLEAYNAPWAICQEFVQLLTPTAPPGFSYFFRRTHHFDAQRYMRWTLMLANANHDAADEFYEHCLDVFVLELNSIYMWQLWVESRPLFGEHSTLSAESPENSTRSYDPLTLATLIGFWESDSVQERLAAYMLQYIEPKT